MLSIHKWWDRRYFDEAHFPTGLGDTLYYIPSDAHFETPEIRLPRPDGSVIPLYRHNINPVDKPDDRMIKVVKVGSGDFWFYRDSRREERGEDGGIYVKTGEGQYVEFGESTRGAASGGGAIKEAPLVQ